MGIFCPTQFVRGERKCIVDVFIFSLSKDHYVINLSKDKLSFTIDTILPDAFFDRERIEEEDIEPAVKQLVLAAFNETQELIHQVYMGQEVKHAPSATTFELPFKCDEHHHKYIIWNK